MKINEAERTLCSSPSISWRRRAFPALHGAFCEDGSLQVTLKAAGVPLVGTDAVSAATAFDKYTCTAALAEREYPTRFPYVAPFFFDRLRQRNVTPRLDDGSRNRVWIRPTDASS